VSDEPANRNLLVRAHPNAFRLCAGLRRLMILAFVGAGVAVAMALVGRVLATCSDGDIPNMLMAVALIAFSVFLGLCIVAYVVRFGVVAMVFARYTLRQLLAVVLILGTCLTLFVQLPGAWRAVPIIGLGILAYVVFIYVTEQDPEGAAAIPQFIRAAQRAKRRMGKPETKETPPPPPSPPNDGG
jgi:signal transduction histidine kinase